MTRFEGHARFVQKRKTQQKDQTHVEEENEKFVQELVLQRPVQFQQRMKNLGS